MKHLYYFIVLALFLAQCWQKPENIPIEFPGKPGVPAAIQNEHDYLLEKIDRLAQLGDSTGVVARKLNELMQHHFQEEEDYVLPALGLLPSLAAGQVPEQREDILELIEKFKAQSPHMSAEHQLIKAFLDELIQAADKDNHPEVVVLSNEIQQHALLEEEVLFPAVILIGERLRSQTGSPPAKSSPTFLRKTPWARQKVEDLYVRMLDDTGSWR